ncbi:Peptidoglycan-binding protein, CsiV [Colwellia chukchiensis]|uniref:Peptidoglycan-binding protein, CsiV n=1 Tax=Colwellia chukchiensis TaxID=641665 RepID=A0A1H7RYY3_9GAMM|nr:CsiV family protein [Colwellia chukchiensis]SEL65433.1 Peptidoglycan-binding protein, CsiV [Colwellia chukchiensis]
MKLTRLWLCSAVLALPLSFAATAQESAERWFEVEVILFSQLGDKTQLKEHFPERSELPNYPQAEDLLARYLNPDIASLKQLLPSCDAPYYAESLVAQKAKLPKLFRAKSLAEIAHTPAGFATTVNDNAQQLSLTDDTDLGQNNHLDNISDAADKKVNLNNEHAAPNAIASVTTNSASSSQASLDLEVINAPLSQQALQRQQRLVLAAEEAFQTLKFQYTPINEPTLLCRLAPSFFANLSHHDANFDYDGFTVNKVPLRIDAAEQGINNQTHLLSRESLQLSDVITDLRYSKNFRPLLHMGWRQVARSKKQATPIKIYAGDNFAAYYQQQLKRYNKQLQAQSVASDTQQPLLLSATEQQALDAENAAQARQQQLTAIIDNLANITDNSDELLASLNLEQRLSTPFETNMPSTAIAKPIAPIQPWFIDGFFNIHLQHYLFISADFSVLDKDLAEFATAQLSSTSTNAPDSLARDKMPKPMKAIAFKQNRRVISGEVHYFDHPYMGMIVQIRPYTKPTPKENN